MSSFQLSFKFSLIKIFMTFYRTVDTVDPAWPSVVVSGNLPRLRYTVNICTLYRSLSTHLHHRGHIVHSNRMYTLQVIKYTFTPQRVI